MLKLKKTDRSDGIIPGMKRSCQKCINTDCFGITVKNGKIRGKQRFKCKSCGKNFIPHNRGADIEINVESLFNEFINSELPSVEIFAKSTRYSKSTIYKHFKKIAPSSISKIKNLCREILEYIKLAHDSRIKNEIKLRLHKDKIQICFISSENSSAPIEALYILSYFLEDGTLLRFTIEKNANIQECKKGEFPFLRNLREMIDRDWIAEQAQKYRNAGRKNLKIPHV